MIKTKNLSDVTLEKKPAATKRFLMKKATLITWPCTIQSRIHGIYFRGTKFATSLAKFL